MTTQNRPRLSIGLPVRNGENFLEEALESILAQTFENFELIISDNASTDSTEAICNAYAALDDRIQYYRNEEDIGGAPNFNRVFELSSAEYFKWAAHDDVCHQDFLLKCIEVLDRDKSFVLCYSLASEIDEKGHFVRTLEPRTQADSLSPSIRFKEALRVGPNYPLFGVLRADVLRRTPLIATYAVSDLVLTAELSLYGRFHEIQEVLFFNREHKQRSSRAHDVRVYDIRALHRFAVWFDPENARKIIFPMWRLIAEYLSAINRPPLPWSERIRCVKALAKVAWPESMYIIKGLLFDLIEAASRILRLPLRNASSSRV
jgi:glycosyltransferase involved in cell wall biosynthesis